MGKGAAASLGPPFQSPGDPPSAAGWARPSLLGGRGAALRATDSPLSDPVSTAKELPLSQALIRDDSCKQAHDSQDKGVPFHQSKLQWSAAAGDGSYATTRVDTRSKSKADPRPVQAALGDPLRQTSMPRILASGKAEVGADRTPDFQLSCKPEGDLNSGNVWSHRRAAGLDAAPRLNGQRPYPAASDGIEGDWSVVRPRYWWRKSWTSTERTRQYHQFDVKGTGLFKLKLKGKCYNCFSPDHLAFCCQAPSRCWLCLQSGHRARYCNRKSSQGTFTAAGFFPKPVEQPSRTPTYHEARLWTDDLHKNLEHCGRNHEQRSKAPLSQPPPIHKKSYLQVVQGDRGMEARYPGDPRGRPSRAFCSVSATGSFRRRRDELIDKAVVCSFDGNSHEVDTLAAGDMLREKFNLRHGQYQLVKHFPEQFFIIFSDPRSKLWALDRGSVSYRDRTFHFGDWSEDSNARKMNLEFRVKVRVEGIPVHCWGEEVASKALGKSCAIHYVQEGTRRRERTRSFDLWAWCSDPCDIPKEVQLTVLEPDRELPPVSAPLPLAGALHDEPSDLKTGHVYTLRNHIEVVEDLSFLRGRGSRGGPPNRKQRREFVWSYGAPDSMGEKREHAETFRGRETGRRGWGQDDDDDEGNFQRGRRSGNRRHRSLSGWARSSRCRGGMEDCYSSNDKHRHSTPFRRHGLGMASSTRCWVPRRKGKTVSFADPVVSAVWPQVGVRELAAGVGATPTRCWVPKRKGNTVSFADPAVSAVWPQVGDLELAAGVGASPGSVDGANQETSKEPDASKCKIASLFTRPLTKCQMEAIMELINQDNVKAGKTKKKGRKVMPTAEAGKAKGF